MEHTEKSSFSRPQQLTPPTPKGREDGHSEQHVHDYRMRPLQQPTPPSPQTREDSGRRSGNRTLYIAGKRLPSTVQDMNVLESEKEESEIESETDSDEDRSQSHTRRKLQGNVKERPIKPMRRTTSSATLSSSSQNLKHNGRSRTQRPQTPYSDPASSSPSPESTTYSTPVVSTQITSSSKRSRFGRKTVRVDPLPCQAECEGSNGRESSSESELEEEDEGRRSKYRRIEQVSRV